MKLFGFVDVGVDDIGDLAKMAWNRLTNRKLDKSNSSVLFIDDKRFPVVAQLQEAGWNVERTKDLIDIEDIKVKRSNIIFVDCKGVGKKLSKVDQGLAIAREIKRKYGSKKRVIMYSEYATYGMDTEYRKYTDNQMSKDSDVYEFISMIETELEELK